MKISWYPGHMHKARKELQRALQTASAVIEILDARAPLASINPLLTGMTSGIPGLKILNKCDLAEETTTSSWQAYFNGLANCTAICCSVDKQGLRKKLIASLNDLVNTESSDGTNRHKVLVVGIPNVGKSTVINALAGRKVARTGNEPAITKGLQQIKLDELWMLIDTPA